MRGCAAAAWPGSPAWPPVVETATLRLLRPLLGVPPGRLRATLLRPAMAWADDPTNADPRFTRARLRALRARSRMGAARRHAPWPASASPDRRPAAGGGDRGRRLARGACDDPARGLRAAAGTAPGRPPRSAVLLRMVAGRRPMVRTPPAVAAIAAAPGATIGGGICLARRAPAAGRPAGRRISDLPRGRRHGRRRAGPAAAVWDGRFRRPGAAARSARRESVPLGETRQAFSGTAPNCRPLVLETLPSYRARSGRTALAVPALNWPDCRRRSRRGGPDFHPPRCRRMGAPFRGACGRCYRHLREAVMPVASSRHDIGDALQQKTSYL